MQDSINMSGNITTAGDITCGDITCDDIDANGLDCYTTATRDFTPGGTREIDIKKPTTVLIHDPYNCGRGHIEMYVNGSYITLSTTNDHLYPLNPGRYRLIPRESTIFRLLVHMVQLRCRMMYFNVNII